MTYLGGYLVLAMDGTSYYSSEAVSSDLCLTKKKRNGTIEYHLQMLAGAFVHPDHKEVIPVCPEMIRMQDGSTKNDCERNASKRFLAHLRREHPHLKIIVTEDGLSSNAPHIGNSWYFMTCVLFSEPNRMVIPFCSAVLMRPTLRVR